MGIEDKSGILQHQHSERTLANTQLPGNEKRPSAAFALKIACAMRLICSLRSVHCGSPLGLFLGAEAKAGVANVNPHVTSQLLVEIRDAYAGVMERLDYDSLAAYEGVGVPEASAWCLQSYLRVH